MTSNRDLRHLQDPNSIQDAFSKLVSSKTGYKSPVEKKEPIFCSNESCKRELEAHQKFCPGCGAKVEKKSEMVICMKCYNVIYAGDKFCANCGASAP